MELYTLEAEAGAISSELAKLGIGLSTRVHVVVRVPEQTEQLPPMAVVAEQGRAFQWLDDEPELYTDGDLVDRVL